MGCSTSSVPEELIDDNSSDGNEYGSMQIESVRIDMDFVTESKSSRTRSKSLSTDATDATDVRHPLRREHVYHGNFLDNGESNQNYRGSDDDEAMESAMISMFGDPEENLEHETETVLK